MCPRGPSGRPSPSGPAVPGDSTSCGFCPLFTGTVLSVELLAAWLSRPKPCGEAGCPPSAPGLPGSLPTHTLTLGRGLLTLARQQAGVQAGGHLPWEAKGCHTPGAGVVPRLGTSWRVALPQRSLVWPWQEPPSTGEAVRLLPSWQSVLSHVEPSWEHLPTGRTALQASHLHHALRPRAAHLAVLPSPCPGEVPSERGRSIQHFLVGGGCADLGQAFLKHVGALGPLPISG